MQTHRAGHMHLLALLDEIAKPKTKEYRPLAVGVAGTD